MLTILTKVKASLWMFEVLPSSITLPPTPRTHFAVAACFNGLITAVAVAVAALSFGYLEAYVRSPSERFPPSN